MRSMLVRPFAWVLLGCMMVLSPACGDDSATLVVFLQTDFRANYEFSAVEVSVYQGREQAEGREPLRLVNYELTEEEGDFLPGRRVGQFRIGDNGLYSVQVRLLDASGRTVSERLAIVALEGRHGVTVSIYRSCRNVECPRPGDAPGNQSCENRECVDPMCTDDERPEGCPEPECMEDEECSSSVACAEARCLPPGICWEVARDENCAEGELCVPGLGGCVPAMTDFEPGMPIGLVNIPATGDALPLGIAVQGNGSMVIVGGFAGQLFPEGYPGHPAAGPFSGGSNDIFVLSLSPTGEVEWVRTFGGAGSDGATAVAVDEMTGDVVVVGQIQGVVPLDGGMSAGSDGTTMAWAFKLNRSGQMQWNVTMSGAGAPRASGVAMSPSGQAFVVGTTDGPLSVGDLMLPWQGGIDIFMLGLSQDGSVQWGHVCGGSGDELTTQVNVDSSGTVGVFGTFQGSMQCAGATMVTEVGESTGDIFAIQMSSSGEVTSLDSWGGPSVDSLLASGVDGAGGSYVLGTYAFSTRVLGTELMSTSTQTGYVAQLVGGAAVSVTELPDTTLRGVMAVAQDGRTFTATAQSAPREEHGFALTELGPDGAIGWTQHGGTWPNVYPQAIALGLGGRIHLVGFFFDRDLVVGRETLTARADGTREGFVATFAP